MIPKRRPDFWCSLCGSIQENETQLILHIATHPSRSNLVCSICDFQVKSSRKRMENHLKEAHPDLFGVQRNLENKERQSLFRCSLCKFSSKVEKRMHTHVNKHFDLTESGKFACRICSKEFDSYIVMDRHKQTHSQTKNFECPICDKTFAVKKYLDSHLLSHQESSDLECSICKAVFRTKGNLNRHLRVHSRGEHAFSCDFCEFTSHRKDIVKAHVQNIHSLATPYPCSICSKKFKLKSSLDKHVLVHSSNQSSVAFRCVECDKDFKRKSTLMTHCKQFSHHPEIRDATQLVTFEIQYSS